jgi:hypothetical protein
LAQHNSRPEVKIELRRAILRRMEQPLKVLETHSGPGVIRRACYAAAEEWVGVDKDSAAPDAIHCDSLLFLRAVDLSGFNIFDVDPFGSPWRHVWLISRQKLQAERIALFVTDGMMVGHAGRVSAPMRWWSRQMASAAVVRMQLTGQGRPLVENWPVLCKLFLREWFDGWRLSAFGHHLTPNVGYAAAMLERGSLGK